MKMWEVDVLDILNVDAGMKTVIIEADDENSAKRKALISVQTGVPGVMAVRARN